MSVALAQAAKAYAAKGALGDKELRALRAKALSGDDTLTPDERIFLDLTEALDADLSYFSLVLVRS